MRRGLHDREAVEATWGGPRGQYAAVGPMVTTCRAQGRPVVSERCTSSEVVRLRVVDEGAYIKRCSGPKE